MRTGYLRPYSSSNDWSSETVPVLGSGFHQFPPSAAQGHLAEHNLPIISKCNDSQTAMLWLNINHFGALLPLESLTKAALWIQESNTALTTAAAIGQNLPKMPFVRQQCSIRWFQRAVAAAGKDWTPTSTMQNSNSAPPKLIFKLKSRNYFKACPGKQLIFYCWPEVIKSITYNICLQCLQLLRSRVLSSIPWLQILLLVFSIHLSTDGWVSKSICNTVGRDGTSETSLGEFAHWFLSEEQPQCSWITGAVSSFLFSWSCWISERFLLQT